MSAPKVYAGLSIAGTMLLAAGALALGLTGYLRAGFAPAFYRAWWLTVAALLAAAGGGMVLRRRWGFYVGFFTVLYALPAAGLMALVANQRVAGIVYLALAGAMLRVVARSAPWFPNLGTLVAPQHNIAIDHPALRGEFHGLEPVR